VLAFIAGEAAPGADRPPARVTKREIARAFGVRGDQKGALKPTAPSRAAARRCARRAACRRWSSPT
jgi:hypothetical protein